MDGGGQRQAPALGPKRRTYVERCVPLSYLTEHQTFERTKLEVLDAAGRLTDRNERLRLKALKTERPARAATLGALVVTSVGYKNFAAKAMKANGNVSICPPGRTSRGGQSRPPPIGALLRQIPER